MSLTQIWADNVLVGDLVFKDDWRNSCQTTWSEQESTQVRFNSRYTTAGAIGELGIQRFTGLLLVHYFPLHIAILSFDTRGFRVNTLNTLTDNDLRKCISYRRSCELRGDISCRSASGEGNYCKHGLRALS